MCQVLFYKTLKNFVVCAKMSYTEGVEHMPKITKEFDKSEYDKRFQKDHYYRLNIVLPKELRTVIDDAVATSGKSKNAYIREAIQEKIEREEVGK